VKFLTLQLSILSALLPWSYYFLPYAELRDAGKVIVTGRVLDGAGKPVEGAAVFVEMLNSFSNSLIIQGTSEADGRFRYESDVSHSTSNERRMFVIGPGSEDTLEFLTGPYYFAQERRPQITGIPIEIQIGQEVNVGDVEVQAWRGVVVVSLRDSQGKPLLPDLESWTKAVVRIRSPRGKVIAGTALNLNIDRKAIRVSDSAIAIGLPEGKFIIEVAPEGVPGGIEHLGTISRRFSKRWLTSKIVNVKRSNSPLQVVLARSLRQRADVGGVK
jgi:hypothetical protein